MNGLRRFFRDEAATADATSTVIMIAAVGILLAAGLTLWYGGIKSFFTSATTQVSTMTGTMASSFPSGS
jgi:Flp pilus assembly pilin Flp